MNQASESLISSLQEAFPVGIREVIDDFHELTVVITPDVLHEACFALRDQHGFEQLVDLFGVDFLGHGEAEWETVSASSTGFSRAVEPATSGRFKFSPSEDGAVVSDRYAVEYLLLSVARNCRIRVRCYCADSEMPRVSSVVDIWNSADWYEREAFDLFGILFEGHPDLRRILTDYGFIGHPFRKDFPQIGNVEMRYDPETRRVVYQPVTIEPRVLVPKVSRPVTVDADAETGEHNA